MDLRDAIEKRLPAHLPAALRTLGEVAARHGERLYLVGGAVRDLVLGRRVPVREVDLVLVGDVGRLARDAEAAGVAQRVARSQFMTLKLEIAGQRGIDLVTARRERYLHPGALPQVEPAGLEEDLRRRDFTINAMATSLSPDDFGQVVDVCGGMEDLRRGLVRVLHERSFQDDATRILRASRYATRFGFHLEQQTESWLVRDAHHLEGISADRLRHELDRIWEEERPEAALAWLRALDVLPRIHPALRWDPELARAFARGRPGRPADVTLPCLYLCLLATRLETGEAENWSARLNLPPGQGACAHDAARLGRVLPDLARDASLPSDWAGRLAGFEPAAVYAWSLVAPEPVADPLARYVTEWRAVRPALSGDDILALGVPRGPLVGTYLARLRRARLDGLVRSEAEERDLVARWANGLE